MPEHLTNTERYCVTLLLGAFGGITLEGVK